MCLRRFRKLDVLRRWPHRLGKWVVAVCLLGTFQIIFNAREALWDVSCEVMQQQVMITLIMPLGHLGSVGAGPAEFPRTSEAEITRRLEKRIELRLWVLLWRQIYGSKANTIKVLTILGYISDGYSLYSLLGVIKFDPGDTAFISFLWKRELISIESIYVRVGAHSRLSPFEHIHEFSVHDAVFKVWISIIHSIFISIKDNLTVFYLSQDLLTMLNRLVQSLTPIVKFVIPAHFHTKKGLI